jgi:hypothetical protein
LPALLLAIAAVLIVGLGRFVPATAEATNAQLPQRGAAANTSGTDARFGVTISTNVTNTLSMLNLAWWYSYGQTTPTGPSNGVAQISVNPTGTCCTRVSAATLEAGALAHPGAAWIIGNEPNVGGQDNVSPGQYASELHYYISVIKAADPTAQIVGPNVLMWDTTCISGCNFAVGHTWVDQFRSAWANQYGGEPPLDVWGIHAYAIDWYHTPMDNANDLQTVETDLTSFSTYLGAIPADASKPVWVTEFGIIWAYQGWTIVSSGCANPPGCFAPTGNYDTSGVASYLNSLLPWLERNSTPQTLRIMKWFAYTDYGHAEPYATTYTGIDFLTDDSSTATASQLGQIYQSLETPPPTLTSTSTSTPTPSSTPSVTATATATSPPTLTPTPTSTSTPTSTLSPTSSPTVTETVTPSNTPTITDTATITPTSTESATPTPTGSHTATPSATASSTASPTTTPSATASPTASATSTPSATESPTATASPTSSASATPSSTPTASATSSPTFLPIDTPVVYVTAVGNATVSLHLPPQATPISQLIVSAAIPTITPQPPRNQLIVAIHIDATDANHQPITHLSAPLTLQITFAPSLNPSANPWLAQISTVENGITQILPTTITFDPTTNLFTAAATVTHLSPFEVDAPRPNTPVPQVFLPVTIAQGTLTGW